MPNFYPKENLQNVNEDKASQKSDFEDLKFSGFEPLFDQEKKQVQPTLGNPLSNFTRAEKEEIK